MEKQETIAKIIDLQHQHGEIMRQHSFPHWMKLGLTAVQFKSLLYIVKTEDANSKKLSDILEVTPANVTGVIDRLIKQGLVQRVANPDDRRVNILHATDKGRKLIANLDENRVEHMAQLLSSLNEEELNHLYKGLTAFINALKKRLQSSA